MLYNRDQYVEFKQAQYNTRTKYDQVIESNECPTDKEVFMILAGYVFIAVCMTITLVVLL